MLGSHGDNVVVGRLLYPCFVLVFLVVISESTSYEFVACFIVYTCILYLQ